MGELEAYYGKPAHISIQVQKERYRMWINNVKAYDLPKAVPLGHIMNQVQIKVSSTNYKDDQYAIYISNFKMAKGLPDTRHKLVDEGKFSTTAILFDVKEATLKPESYGTIKDGIDEARLQTDGKGESEPVGDNKTKEGKAANKRIDMTVIK